MDKYETGQDTRLIAGGREFNVTNVEENPGEVELSEAEGNMRMENYTAPAGVSHSLTVTVDGSARELDRACYNNRWRPKTGLRMQTRGSEAGTRYRQGKPTSRARSVPAKDGTETEIDIRFDQANMTS